MKLMLTRKRWIGIGIAVFLAAFGIAFAVVTWVQVSRTVPSVLTVTSTTIISGDNISLWWDINKMQPVTGAPAIQWTKAQTQPPLRQLRIISEVNLYIVNESQYPLIPMDPCRNLHRSNDNTRIGWTHAWLHDLSGNWRGDVCDDIQWRKDHAGWVMNPGEMWKITPHPHFDTLVLGDHYFDLVFGAVGYTGSASNAPFSSRPVGEVLAPEDYHPRPPSE